MCPLLRTERLKLRYTHEIKLILISSPVKEFFLSQYDIARRRQNVDIASSREQEANDGARHLHESVAELRCDGKLHCPAESAVHGTKICLSRICKLIITLY